ncbi:hypothetical protein GCM10011574_33500 [Microbispora bryophytorum]|uniref:Uncharacterized protein n=1 Tax=Microbispora bryophytorum TaxID=1460882 RepID=A0A8H9H4V0_9ACTN|nr:hypothetical protein GCM10011574_33500 [Microbispora bryophytorum]
MEKCQVVDFATDAGKGGSGPIRWERSHLRIVDWAPGMSMTGCRRLTRWLSRAVSRGPLLAFCPPLADVALIHD